MAAEILTQYVDPFETAALAMPSDALAKKATEEAQALTAGVARAWTLAGIAMEKVEGLDSDTVEAEALIHAMQKGLHADDIRAVELSQLVNALVQRLAKAEASLAGAAS